MDKRQKADYMRHWQKTANGKRSMAAECKRWRDAAVARLGGRCANPACQWLNADGSRGCTDRRCLQIDHIDGGGIRESQKIGTHGIYRKIWKGQTAGYQLLCANCNWIKRAIKGEHRQLEHRTDQPMLEL